jgi:hypothetical protein
MAEEMDDHSLHAAINVKLAEIADASPTPPVWYEAWSRLNPQSTDTERLALYRAVRDAGSVPEDAGLFLIAWMLDVLSCARAEEALHEVEDHLEEIRLKHGLDEDASADDDGMPDEYREAMQQSRDAWDNLYLAVMEEFGEHDMARLFRDDETAFDEQYEAGRQFFHGADDESARDEWLDSLLDAVAACVEVDSPTGPLGLRCREEDGFWEIWVYPTPVELVGGRHDGAVVVAGFALDLEQLRECFDSVVAFNWNALGLNYPEGPHVSIEGVFQGREVFLQVLAHAPEDEQPGMQVDMSQRPRG